MSCGDPISKIRKQKNVLHSSSAEAVFTTEQGMRKIWWRFFLLRLLLYEGQTRHAVKWIKTLKNNISLVFISIAAAAAATVFTTKKVSAEAFPTTPLYFYIYISIFTFIFISTYKYEYSSIFISTYTLMYISKYGFYVNYSAIFLIMSKSWLSPLSFIPLYKFNFMKVHFRFIETLNKLEAEKF